MSNRVIEKPILINPKRFLVDTRGWTPAEIGVYAHVMMTVWHDLFPPRRMKRRRRMSFSRRQAIFARDGAFCRYCGAFDAPLEIDHVVPLAKGGTDDEDNLCVACGPCNRSKGALLISEWRP